jgi:siroheme synthase-like protein
MPISVSLKGRPCLVVGGGPVALRKVERLLDYEPEITVVAPEVDRKFEYFAERGKIRLEQRAYRQGEATEYGLVIAASDDRSLNRQISDDCRSVGVLVNVVDDPAYCNFIYPSVVRRDCLTAAISTDGRAPFVSGHLREVLGTVFPEHWAGLMKHATAFRKLARERWKDDPQSQLDCYDRFLRADWKTMLKERTTEEIRREMERMLDDEYASQSEA